MTKLIYVAIMSAFVNNVVLGQMFGVNAVIRGSEKIGYALRLSLSVIVVTFLSSVVTWPVGEFLLNRFGLSFLQPMVFLIIEAVIVLVLVKLVKVKFPKRKQVYSQILPLIVINSAVLGVILMNVQVGYSFLRSTVNSVCGGLGFAAAVIILAGVRERIRFNDVPKPFEGVPILLVVSGLMAIAFYGFTGLV
ncbi:MAG: electron transport complex subunit RsxA [Parasporobacterium sp.]|nr:electron transport complex subunit RsxA [Parasporobacterium sp.]